MPSTAMFHRLGTVCDTDVYLEKYSRSLVCLGAPESQYLACDCNRDVTVSDEVKSFLCRSRLPRKPLQRADPSGSLTGPGVELTLIISNRCNFACSYCFAADLYPGSDVLAPDTIVRHVRQFLHLSHARVSSLILFGGEPLLAFTEMKQAWTEVRKLFDHHQGTMPSLAIVTNGSLITRDIAAFLAENDIAVTVSLDGPRAVHDLCRPFRGGRGSYERVVEGIDELARAGAFYAIESTYTARHLQLGIDVIAVVDHARRLNAQEVHVMPAFPEQVSGIDPSDEAHVAAMFKAAAARATARYLTSGVNELAYACRLSYAFAHDRRRRYVCTAGIDKFTIMANGDVVPCYLVSDSDHRIASCSGLQMSHGDRALREQAALGYQTLVRDDLPGCSRCWASDWCFACYGPGYARNRRLGSPGGLECKIYQAMTEATLLECVRFLLERSVKIADE